MHSETLSLPVLLNGLDLKSGPTDNVIDVISQTPHEGLRKSNDGRRLRVVLYYSQDTMSLGHIRRNLLLAQGFSDSGLAIDVLLITGARESGGFSLPEGVGVVVLPVLHKAVGAKSRTLSPDLDDLTATRSQIVRSTVESFQPDLVIVDSVARGENGELDQALEYISEHRSIRCVLGLRDIQDEPENCAREWQEQRFQETIRNFYDAIWVYGDARVFDPRKEYNLPTDIARKVHFTGYLEKPTQSNRNTGTDRSPRQVNKPFGLCLVGSGLDGVSLATAFAHATHPAGMDAVIITGPYMNPASRAKLQRLTTERPHLKLLEFVEEPTEILRDAEYVVSMGGYNTVCEVISSEKPALVVPGVASLREQTIRAERLQNLGIIDMLHPESLSANSLSGWIISLSLPGRQMVSAREIIDMNGMQRLPQYFLEQVMLLGRPVENQLSWVAQ